MARLRQFAYFGMLFFLVVFLWLVWGHYYRFPLPAGDFLRDEAFEEMLFHNVRSKRDALKYIENTYRPKGEKETLFAVYDFVKKRFYH